MASCDLDPELYPSWKFKIEILSGQHIQSADESSDILDPYVKVRLRGHIDDEKDQDGAKINKGKTEHVKNNGFNPTWNATFYFESKVPDLAFLEFKVKDHSMSGTDKALGMFCCPLKSVQQGFRRVSLKSYSGKNLAPATLLVKITIEN